MTTAQWLYAGLIATYTTMFLLFCRMLYWRYYANKHYYNKRPQNLSEANLVQLAQEHGREVPRISIFVPARNEADVIEKTVDHLAHMRYESDRYEILVVTDEKESQAAVEERQAITSSLTAFLAGDSGWSGAGREEDVLIALLSQLALDEADLAERKAAPYLSVKELQPISPQHRVEILSHIALALVTTRGKFNREQHLDAIRRRLPKASAAEIARLYPTFLSFALPTVMAAVQLKKEDSTELAHRLMTEAAQARQPLTQKVLITLTEAVSSRIVKRARNADPADLAAWLQDACELAIPTTQEIVERKRLEFAGRRDLPRLGHVVVPWDFDGLIGGVCTGESVPSTKGRALNYAFGFADPQTEVWAFYDAESRPDVETLLYVAWRRIVAGEKFRIAQGPVYQIRNFWKTGPLCKVAGLYQAVSHEWQMPYLLRSVPFIGGTNIFATRELMLRIGGFDDTVLTEDMELGVRAWLTGDAWPEFLPYASSEQTPPTFKAFFRQRLRWGSGYLQVWDKLKADHTFPQDRKNKLLRIYWWKGHFSWTVFQMVALLPLVVFNLRANDLLDSSGAPITMQHLMMFMAPTYLLFTLYIFFHFYPYMDGATKQKKALGFTHLLVLPLSAFFLPVPYSSALVLKLIGRQPKGWVKTPRTKE